MTKVSVVITVLNEAATLEQLLTALAHQTFKPAEVVIVDGGSSDGTWQLLKQQPDTFPLPLRVFQKNGNRSIGRNWAITKATSPVIAITDAGCIPHLNWLAELVKKFDDIKQHTTQAVVVAGYYDARPQTAFESAVVPYVLVMPDKVNPADFLPATRSMLLERRAWQLVDGFNEKLSHNEDYALAHQLAADPRVKMVFTADAKVTWLPRTTLDGFMRMIYRFAKGDVEAGIWRLKVKLIFVRYVALAVVSMALIFISFKLLVGFWLLGALLYSGWAIVKNYHYAGRGWFWLPVLQLSSDFAIMSGSLRGVIHDT